MSLTQANKAFTRQKLESGKNIRFGVPRFCGLRSPLGGRSARKVYKMTADEIENDLKRYFKFMMNGNIDGCIAIEEKYGLFGATPEMVTTELREAAQQLRALDAATLWVCEWCGVDNKSESLACFLCDTPRQ